MPKLSKNTDPTSTILDFNLQHDGAFLEKRRLADGIFQLLYRRIIAGEYRPDDWLRQEELASELDVSPTPVREALDQLVSAGLAERIPYRGVHVPKPRKQEIVDSYAARLLLEVAIAHLAAHHITQKHIDALYDILKQMETMATLDDIPKHRQLNKALHMTIAMAGGNPLLAQLYQLVSNKFPDWMLYERVFRKAELLQPSFEQEFTAHTALVDAVASRDPNLAAQQAVKHIQGLGRELVMLFGISASVLEEKEKEMWPLPRKLAGFA